MQGPAGQAADRPNVENDVAFQRRVWRFERAGWVVMGLLILASLVGLAGPGVLSNTASGDERLQIEYERFSRHQAPTSMTIHVGPSAIENGAVTLVLNEAFTDKFQIDRVVPTPDQWQLGKDGVHLRVLAKDANAAGAIHLYLKPQGFGPAPVTVGLAGSSPIRLWQFVYP